MDVVKVKRADHYLPIFSLKSIKTKLIYKHMNADSPNESFTNNEFIKKIQMLMWLHLLRELLNQSDKARCRSFT